MIDSNVLLNLIPPAIIISFAVFLIKFFGKALSDQTPFADDRKWKEEIEGTTFFLFHILIPFSGALLLISRGFNIFNLNDISFIVIALLVAYVSNLINKYPLEFFIENKAINKNDYKEKKAIINGVSYFIFIIITCYYIFGSYLYIIPASVFLFINLLCLALFSSLKEENIMIGDIYFSNKSKNIKKCIIIKVNDDNIRLLKDDKMIIVNKGLIERIEIKYKKKDE